MTSPKPKVYKSSSTKQLLTKTIHENQVTPIVEVKFSNLNKPFYYANSPKIARYAISCAIELTGDQGEFVQFISSIEEIEKVPSILKNEMTKEGNDYINSGRILLKFSDNKKIPVYVVEKESSLEKAELIELEDEFSVGEKVKVVFDIVRYTKKNNALSPEYAICLKPKKIYFYPSEEAQA